MEEAALLLVMKQKQFRMLLQVAGMQMRLEKVLLR